MIFRIVLSVLFCCAVVGGAHAQGFPNKPIRLVVPYPAGGGLDVLARAIAEGLNNKWQQPVIVDNRAGAAGNIGAEAVFRAPPDGYTLLVTTEAPIAVNKSLYRKLAFDPDLFVPVSILTNAPMLITVNASTPVKTLQEFIAYGKDKPGQLAYGSAGVGGSSHLSVALFEMMSGTKFNHVPYKGMAPATADMLAGHVNFVFGFESGLAPYFNSDKVKILAVTSEKRHPALPGVPTVAETLPGYVVSSWFGVFAPPGTPADIVTTLATAILEVLRTPDVQKRIATLGQVVLAKSPTESKAFVLQDAEQWRKVIRETGTTAD